MRTASDHLINAMPTDIKLVAGPSRTEPRPQRIALRAREVEALTWVARGKTSIEIAQIVGLSKRTVDFHIDNARVKLDAATRSQAVSEATAKGLIAP